VLIGRNISKAAKEGKHAPVNSGAQQADENCDNATAHYKKRAVVTENPLTYGSVDEIGTLLRQPKVVIRFFEVLNQST
jgi:hypothetical protein